MSKKSRYKLNPKLNDFLTWLGEYKVEFPDGTKVWEAPQTPKEVETELKKVAKKLGIRLDL